MLLRLVCVMAPASQLEILNRRLATSRVRHDMMEFQEAALRAAAARAYEGALPAITSPDLPLDRRWYVARPR